MNMHSDVTCSMGVDHPISSMSYYYNNDEIDNMIRNLNVEKVKFGAWKDDNIWEITPYNFREKFSNALHHYIAGPIIKVHHPTISFPQRVFGGCIASQMAKHVLTELQMFYTSKVYGNVHGFSPYHCIKDPQALYQNDITLAHLIGNPIKRLRSRLTHAKMSYRFNFFNYREQVPLVCKNYKDDIELIKRKYQISDFDIEQQITYLSFRNGSVLREWEDEIYIAEKLDIPQMRIEKMSFDPDYYKSYFMHLTGIKPDESYLQRVFTKKNYKIAHTTKESKRNQSMEEIFESFYPWLRDRITLNIDLYKKHRILLDKCKVRNI